MVPAGLVTGPLNECGGGLQLGGDLSEHELLVVVVPGGLEQFVQRAGKRRAFARQAVQLGVQGVGEAEYGSAG
ncbi:hypothetical protein AB0D94_08455 [Streptomyces sp. NPDC048255]|uniref:hypothetical protein n=1 Tax=Streptomyces sp. NPDC048255 TaxID=3154713 RepID=UPI0033CB6B9A